MDLRDDEDLFLFPNTEDSIEGFIHASEDSTERSEDSTEGSNEKFIHASEENKDAGTGTGGVLPVGVTTG